MKTVFKVIGVLVIAALLAFLAILPDLLIGEEKDNKVISISSEPVDAIIIYDGSSKPIEYITAGYGNNELKLGDKDIVNTYKNNVGSTIRLVLITWTYEDGSVEEKLVFNKDVYNGGDIK